MYKGKSQRFYTFCSPAQRFYLYIRRRFRLTKYDIIFLIIWSYTAAWWFLWANPLSIVDMENIDEVSKIDGEDYVQEDTEKYLYIPTNQKLLDNGETYNETKSDTYLGLYGYGLYNDMHPISFHSGAMSPELLKLIQSDALFTAPEDQLEKLGMYWIDINTEYPMLPFHNYYEGYFHAFPNKGKLKALNPRFDYDDPGREIFKLPAPLAIRAFINKLVELNPIDELVEEMPDTLLIKKYLADKKYFRDIAIQMHWGQELPVKHLRWHWDAVNSVIHMGISIRGKREVWQVNQERNSSNLQYEWVFQQEGDYYISSPHGVLHAPRYPESTWDTRIVAIMCRIYFAGEEYMTLEKNLKMESKPALNHITKWLHSRTLRTPTHKEVLEEMKNLKVE